MSVFVARLRGERGEGLVEAPLLLAGVLLPLLLLVPLFARLELARLAVEQAAQDAARAAVEAPNEAGAQQAARLALARAQAASDLPLRLTLTGRLARGETIVARVSVTVPLVRLPGLGRVGSVVVRASASIPVDRYRSLPAPP